MNNPKKFCDAMQIASDVLMDQEEDNWAMLSHIFDNDWKREDAIDVCQKVTGLDFAIKLLNKAHDIEAKKWRQNLIDTAKRHDFTEFEVDTYAAILDESGGLNVWINFRNPTYFWSALEAYWNDRYDRQAEVNDGSS